MRILLADLIFQDFQYLPGWALRYETIRSGIGLFEKNVSKKYVSFNSFASTDTNRTSLH